MKVFLTVLILIFSLQSLTKADDIGEFELEGISIGDSLLDHYGQEKITNGIKEFYDDDEFSATIFLASSDLYKYIQFHFKTYDKNFTVYSIDAIFFNDNLKDCIKKRDKILNEISEVFINLKKEIRDNKDMASGIGKLHRGVFTFNSGDFVEVSCYQYHNEDYGTDHGRVAIVTKELNNWIVNKAHK